MKYALLLLFLCVGGLGLWLYAQQQRAAPVFVARSGETAPSAAELLLAQASPLPTAARRALAVPSAAPLQTAPRAVHGPPLPTADKAADLTTLSGKTYKQARVFRVEPDGINYIFAGGIVKISFTDLPEAVGRQYGYDPKAAAAFATVDAAQQQAAYNASQATIGQQAADVESTEKARKLLELVEKSSLSGDFEVSQVFNDGFLAYPSGFLTAADGKAGPMGGPIFIASSSTDTLVDNQMVHLTIYLAGTYKYTSVSGAARTIPRYASDKASAARLDVRQFAP